MRAVIPLVLPMLLLMGCQGHRPADCTPAEITTARQLWAEYCTLDDAGRQEESNRAWAAFQKAGPAGIVVVAEVLAAPGSARRRNAAGYALQAFAVDDPTRRKCLDLIWPYLGEKKPGASHSAAVFLSRFADDSLPDRAVELVGRNIRPGPNEGYAEDLCLVALARLSYKRARHIFLEQLKARRDEPFRNTPSPGACEIWDLPLGFVVKYLARQNDPEANEALLDLARHRFTHPPEGQGPRRVQLYYLAEALGQVCDERSVAILVEQVTGERYADPAQDAIERLTGRTDLHGQQEWRRWADQNRGHLLKAGAGERPGK